MPNRIETEWTLRKLLQSSYQHKRNRFDYQLRDLVRYMRVEKITRYSERESGAPRITYQVLSQSIPQYSPYFTKKDSRGRPRRRQMTYRHEYSVTISLNELSIDSPVKLRTGAIGLWDFGPGGAPRKDRRTGRIVEGSNQRRQLNGDHFFTQEWVRAQAGCLFGRCYANGPPGRTNPHHILFLTKHEIAVVQALMNQGILR